MAEQRYEREIDELLKRLEAEHREPLPFRMRRRGSPWARAWSRLGPLLGPRSTVERLMALAAVLLLATFVLRFVAPALAWALVLIALGCFVSALGLSVWGGVSRRGTQGRWSAEQYPPAGRAVDWDALGWRLRRWFNRFRR
jgi:hypothetical protein